MEDMQSRMNSILENPEMMEKIMTMAQSMSQSSQDSPPAKQEQAPPQFPDIDLSMVQKLSGLASQSGIDKNQRNLLSALTPYLSKDRISRLEKAMRAAKMANMASAFLGNSAFSFHSGR